MRSLDIAHSMGIQHVGGILYSAFGTYAAAPDPRSYSAAAKSLAEVAERAADLHVSLALEVVNRYESNLINTVEQCLDLLDLIGSGNVFIHLDAFHMNIEERHLSDALTAALPRLKYFELDQNDRGSLTGGGIDFDPLLRLLDDYNYAEWIGIEGFSSSLSAPSVANAVAAGRPTFEDNSSMVRKARALLGRYARDDMQQ